MYSGLPPTNLGNRLSATAQAAQAARKAEADEADRRVRISERQKVDAITSEIYNREAALLTSRLEEAAAKGLVGLEVWSYDEEPHYFPDAKMHNAAYSEAIDLLAEWLTRANIKNEVRRTAAENVPDYGFVPASAVLIAKWGA